MTDDLLKRAQAERDAAIARAEQAEAERDEYQAGAFLVAKGSQDLRAMVDDCALYLKEGETPRQRMDRDQRDVLALMDMLAKDRATRDEAIARAEKAEAELAIGSFYQEKDIDALQDRAKKAEAQIDTAYTTGREDGLREAAEIALRYGWPGSMTGKRYAALSEREEAAMDCAEQIHDAILANIKETKS